MEVHKLQSSSLYAATFIDAAVQKPCLENGQTIMMILVISEIKILQRKQLHGLHEIAFFDSGFESLNIIVHV